MNRLKDLFGEPPQPEPDSEEDYFEVETHYDIFAVRRETAAEIERRLDSLPTPHWVAFRDLVGARHRILVAHVYRISESTPALRAACRAFHRARRLEAKADRRPWEDDD